jgi:hypothetical protein
MPRVFIRVQPLIERAGLVMKWRDEARFGIQQISRAVDVVGGAGAEGVSPFEKVNNSWKISILMLIALL